MPFNKNALQRYRILDSCFSNFNKKYFINDLIDAVSDGLSESAMSNVRVSRRQIFLDMEYMKSSDGWEIPLESIREVRKTYYRYSDRSYTIQNSPLKHNQFQLLQDSLELLTSVSGIPEVNQFIPVLEKITHSKNMDIQSLVSFQANDNNEGIQWFSPVFQSLRNKTVLKIHYQSFKNEQVEVFLLHPYFLKQFNNRWFLFGLHEENQVPTWNVPLDRIVEIEFTDLTYRENTEINFAEYFDDVVGVTILRDAKLELIELEVMSWHVPYVKSKPLHPSQKKIGEMPNGNVLYQLKLIPNHEFYALLMSNIDKFKVVTPLSVRQEIASRLELGLKLNTSIPTDS